MRREKEPEVPVKRGRPEAIPPEARWKIREQYLAKYGQWDSSVLKCWAEREGIGSWSATTIGKAIVDLKPKPQKKAKPSRYEIVAPGVMWSEDGSKFKERGKKRELLVLQDECARYKLNWKLANKSADASNVCEYLAEAFEKHGAPLILKHDGGSIFHEREVRELLDKYGVVDLTSPPYYPPFNGKKERSFRDIKGFVRAMHQNGPKASLSDRIDAAIHDLNEERPRPVLGGRIAREVFFNDRIPLPKRRKFKMEVETKQIELTSKAESSREKDSARRRAVTEVLLSYGLLKWRGDVSTYLENQTGTN